MAKKIGAKIVLEGESEYRSAIKNINSAQKELRSEMKLCTTEFDGQQNSIEALTKKDEILAKQLQNQQDRVEELSKMYQRASDAQEDSAKKVESLSQEYENAKKALEDMTKSGTASEDELKAQQKAVEQLDTELVKAQNEYDATTQSVQSWKTQLNNAQADLNKLNSDVETNAKYLSEAKNSSDGHATSIDGMGKAIKGAADESSIFSDVLSGTFISSAIMGGLDILIDKFIDLSKYIVETTNEMGLFADDINTLSIQTGISTKTLQEMYYMQDLLDTSVNDVTNSMKKNIRTMYQAQQGSATAQEAYRKLGVEYEDSVTKKLRDSNVVFWEVIDALGEQKNETERDALAMQVFGKSAQSLNTLIEAGSEGYREYAEEAQKMGYVLDQDVLDSLNATNDAHDRMNLSFEVIKRTIAEEYAPALEQVYALITDFNTEISTNSDNLTLEDTILQKLRETFIQNSDAITQTSDAVDDLTESENELVTASVEVNGVTYELRNATEEQKTKLEELAAAYMEAKQNAIDSISSQVGLFSELSAQSDLTINQMTTNLQGQTEVFSQYGTDIDTLKGKISDELLLALMDLGINGAGYVHELATSSETDLATLEESFQAMIDAKDALAESFAEAQTGFEETFGLMTDTSKQSLTDMADNIATDGVVVVENAVTVVKDVEDSVKAQLQMTDGETSDVYKTVGKAIPESMRLGIISNRQALLDEMRSTMQSLLDIANEYASPISTVIDKALGNAAT